MFKKIMKLLPKRIIHRYNRNHENYEYYPQYWMIWWHFCYRDDAYCHESKISFLNLDTAIKYAEHNWDSETKRVKRDRPKEVWRNKR